MTTEFNSNFNLGAIQKQTNVKPAEVKEDVQAAPIEEIEEPKSTGVLVGQSAIAGKSQIKTDSIGNDLTVLMANPKLIEKASAVFDKAYAALVKENDPEAYEKACLICSQFVVECGKK